MVDALSNIVFEPPEVSLIVVLAVSPVKLPKRAIIGESKLVIISVPEAKYLNILNPKNAKKNIIIIANNIFFILKNPVVVCATIPTTSVPDLVNDFKESLALLILSIAEVTGLDILCLNELFSSGNNDFFKLLVLLVRLLRKLCIYK